MTSLIQRAIALLMVPFIITANAAADRYSDCTQGKDIERRIRGCASIIERGKRESRKNRGAAYINRCLAYKEKRAIDRAIADCTRAIEINPKYANTYNSRGIACAEKGNFDRAIADYTHAIEINPKDAPAYGARGAVHL